MCSHVLLTCLKLTLRVFSETALNAHQIQMIFQVEMVILLCSCQTKGYFMEEHLLNMWLRYVSVNYFCFDILLPLCNFLIQFQFIFYQIFAGEDPSSNFTVMFDIFSSLLLITSNGYVFEQTLLAVCVVKYNHTLMLDWYSCHGNSMPIPHIIQSD